MSAQLRLIPFFVRLLAAVICIGGAVLAYRYALLPLLQQLLQLDDAALASLRRCGILLSMLLAYWGYIHFVEKRRATELVFTPTGISLGALSGVLMIALVSVILFATGVYEVLHYRGLQAGLWDIAFVIVIAATIEEVLFRAVLFQALERQWGTVKALWLQSILFSVLHIANLDPDMGAAELVVTVISGTLIGIFWTLLFVYSRNVWVVAANHAAWNFSVVMTGLPLSGLSDWQSLAPLQSVYHGPNWLSGGSVGPEDSIATVLLVLLSSIALYVFANKRQKFTVPLAP